MTPEIEDKLVELKHIYGPYSLTRIENMLHKRGVVNPLQKGARLVVPGLSTEPWLSTRQFKPLQGCINALEQASGDIKREIWRLIDDRSTHLQSYVHYLGRQSDWSALYLYKEGKKNESVRELLPVTYGIMETHLLEWLCPVSEMHFSVLDPGARIAPHSDLCNFAVNLHLAVDIPENCHITVAGETRQWEEGKCLMFDYSFIHEACNLSDKKRVCLLMDVWHPDVTAAEREALVFVAQEFRKMVSQTQ